MSSRFARLVNAAQTPTKQDSPSKSDSPSVQDSQTDVDGQALLDSPSKSDSLTKMVSPSTKDSQLLALVPHVKGHTELPHAYTDHLARWLSADEQAVYVQLYRLSWGWGKDTCFISNPRLSERSGVPETSMRRAVKKLASKGLVEKTERVFGSRTEQGIEYRVFLLNRLSKEDRVSSKDGPSNMAPNKERILKEIDQKGIDASRCPDCMGTGFYYPSGKEKGVARCEHKRLKA